MNMKTAGSVKRGEETGGSVSEGVGFSLTSVPFSFQRVEKDPSVF